MPAPYHSMTYKNADISCQYVADCVRKEHPRGLICLPEIDDELAAFLECGQSVCTDGVVLTRGAAFFDAGNAPFIWEYNKRTGKAATYIIVRPGGS